MTTVIKLRSRMMGNYQVRFWRAVEGVTSSLTLIILELGLCTVGHTGINASGDIDLCLGGETPQGKSSRGKRKPHQ